MWRILAQLTRREAHPAVQFVKYGIAGGLATAVDLFCFYLAAILIFPALKDNDPVAQLLSLHPAALADGLRSMHYLWDKIIAFMFSNLTAYVVNILWVFTPGRHSKAMEITLFYLVSIVSFSIGTGLAWMLIKWGGLPTTHAYVANVVVSILINYVCRKFIVFKS